MRQFWNIKRHWPLFTLAGHLLLNIGAWLCMMQAYRWELWSSDELAVLGEFLLTSVSLAVVMVVFYGATILQKRWLYGFSAMVSWSYLAIALFPGVPFSFSNLFLFRLNRYGDHLCSFVNVFFSGLPASSKDPFDPVLMYPLAALAALTAIAGVFVILERALSNLVLRRVPDPEKGFSYGAILPAALLGMAGLLHAASSLFLPEGTGFHILPCAAFIGGGLAVLSAALFLTASRKKKRFLWIASMVLNGILLAGSCCASVMTTWGLYPAGFAAEGWFLGSSAGNGGVLLNRIMRGASDGLLLPPLWVSVMMLVAGLLGLFSLGVLFYKSARQAVPVRKVREHRPAVKLWPVFLLLLGVITYAVIVAIGGEGITAELYWKNVGGSWLYGLIAFSLPLILAAFYCYAVKKNARSAYLAAAALSVLYVSLILTTNLIQFRPIDFWSGGSSYPGAFTWVYVARIFTGEGLGASPQDAVMEFVSFVSVTGMLGASLWHLFRRPDSA